MPFGESIPTTPAGREVIAVLLTDPFERWTLGHVVETYVAANRPRFPTLRPETARKRVSRGLSALRAIGLAHCEQGFWTLELDPKKLGPIVTIFHEAVLRAVDTRIKDGRAGIRGFQVGQHTVYLVTRGNHASSNRRRLPEEVRRLQESIRALLHSNPDLALEVIRAAIEPVLSGSGGDVILAILGYNREVGVEVARYTRHPRRNEN